jgi:hypothetical protein
MSNDSRIILAELERGGWQITETGTCHIAIHPDAEQPIRFGGRYGWTLNRIRRDAARALGQLPTQTHRGRNERQHRTEQATARRDARQTHVSARDEQIRHENTRRAVIARYDELNRIRHLMRAG